MKGETIVEFQSSQKTAKKAAEILAAKGIGFIVPNKNQRLNLLERIS